MDSIDLFRRKLIKAGIVGAALTQSLKLVGEELPNPTTEIATEQIAQLSRIADAIIPPTDSPSASAVGADRFAVQVFLFALGDEVASRFIADVCDLERHFCQETGVRLSGASNRQIYSFISYHIGDPKARFNWLLYKLRQFVITGWVLEESIANGCFNYTHTLGRYDPNYRSEKEILFSNLDRLYI